ncbi:MAG: hypothetical protein DRP27_03655 [Thermotogae bacterium]|nr:MAG: hypothetical protein DRP27_03655 [Thermotogota bacterium]
MSDQPERQDPRALNPVKHGAYRWITRGLLPLCDKCPFYPDSADCPYYAEGQECKPLNDYRTALTKEIMALPHIKPVHWPLVVNYVSIQVFLRIIEGWCSKVGPVLPCADEGHVNPQPALAKNYTSFSNAALRLATELGITPRVEAELQAKARGDMSRQLAAAIQQMARRECAESSNSEGQYSQNKRAVDAEFEAEEAI